MTVRLGELISVLEAAYPPALAESWDTGIGLTCGDPQAAVSHVLLAVDLEMAVLAEAEELGAQLVLTHHPLLFRPLQSVAVDTVKGALIHEMITSGVAHYAAHTNADKAVGGVNDSLAAVLGLTGVRPLVPDAPDALPPGHPQAGLTGTGRVGELPVPCTLAELTDRVARLLPPTVSGVRSAGDAHRVIRTLALCGGAGDSELDSATASGADAYLTSDLRHHVVQEHLAGPGAAAVIEVAHWAGEWPWLDAAAALLTGAVADGILTGNLTTTVSSLRTDPWTVHRPSGSS